MTPDHDMRHVGTAPVRSAQPTPRAFYDQSWALVIGLSDYQDPQARLANARNDAEAVAKLLKETYHFEHVTLLCDAEATHAAIMSWLRDQLPAQVGRNDRFVFFFAGHGVSRAGSAGQTHGYLMPQDAQIGRYASYIDMDEVRKACGLIEAKHIFLILDCCFSGIAAVTTRATLSARPERVTDAYLQHITELPAWQVLTAGASDELVADSGSRPGHSAFTSALLAGFEGWADDDDDGIITASDLAEYVQQTVSHETASGRTRQFPYFSYLAGSGHGDFVFMRPVQPPPRPEDRPVPADPPPVPERNKTDPESRPRRKGWLRIWVLGAAVLLTAVGIYFGLKQAVIVGMGRSEHYVAFRAAVVASRLGWLSDGSLYGANLQGANLQGADLQDAGLYGANLQDANLQGAILQDAYLPGANLQDANLQDANLDSAFYDHRTKWPAGYTPPAEAIYMGR